MPKRSNRFQKLVHLIQTIFAEDSEVTESAMLEDLQTCAPVEIDVLVSADVGGTKIAVGIECRDRKRPATVEWIREMKGKHEHLPINKSVLISSSGFTEEARKKAIALGIDTLTLSEAKDTDWRKYIESLSSLKFAGFIVSLLETTIIFKNPSIIDPSRITQESVLFERNTEYRGTVNEYANHFIHDSRVIKATTQKWLQKQDRPFEFEPTLTWTPQQEVVLVDIDETEHIIESMKCKVRITVNETPMVMKSGRFREVNIATGEVEDVFEGDSDRKFLIVVKEENGRIGSGVLLTPEGKVRKFIQNDPEKKTNT